MVCLSYITAALCAAVLYLSAAFLALPRLREPPAAFMLVFLVLAAFLFFALLYGLARAAASLLFSRREPPSRETFFEALPDAFAMAFFMIFAGFGGSLLFVVQPYYRVTGQQAGTGLTLPILLFAAAFLFPLAERLLLRTIFRDRRRLLGRRLLLVFGTGALLSLCAAAPGLIPRRPERRPASAPPPEQLRTGRRLCLIAVDGADWRVLDPLLAAGRAPNLARLIAEGRRGMLKSTFPFLSNPCMASIITGKSFAKHGAPELPGLQIRGRGWLPLDTLADEKLLCPMTVPALIFLQLGLLQATPPSSCTIKAKMAWQILGEAGMTVLASGWPSSRPAHRVPGVIVSDRVARSPMEFGCAADAEYPQAVFPPALEPRVRAWVEQPLPEPEPDLKRLGTFTRRQTGELSMTGIPGLGLSSQLAYLKFAHLQDRFNYRVVTELAPGLRPAFTAVYFAGLDMGSHLFWADRFPGEFPERNAGGDGPRAEVLNRYYEYIDRWIGGIRAALGPGVTFLIVSDHGFGPIHGNPWISSWHAEDGVIIASGPGIKKGRNGTPARLTDILPTLLYLAGLPAAGDMDGRALTEMLDPGPLRRAPVRTIASYE